MQLNSTFVPVLEMDQQHPPPPLPPAATPTVHRHTAASPCSAPRQGPVGSQETQLIRLTSSPPLPMRLSEVRLLESSDSSPRLLFGGGRRDRTGIRSKPSRSNPNEYVEEPVFSILPDRSDGKTRVRSPSTSPSSPSAPLTPHSTSSPAESTPPSPSKEKSDRTVVSPSSFGDACKESIFCPRCHRCRCIKCQQRRRLPTLRCSPTGMECLPEEVVDCCSCLTCARAVYRRCSDDFSDDHDDQLGGAANSSSSMCACTGRGCCRRWTLLTALSPCLPCLCLYWPLRWLLSACSVCYNCRRRGCQCSDDRRGPGQGGGGGQGGALLISDELLSSNSSSSA